jgi:dihydroflavonol-4-reductase
VENHERIIANSKLFHQKGVNQCRVAMHLVTGATGHLGNVLIRELLHRGEHVRALVRPGKPPISLEGLDVEIILGDVLELASLDTALKNIDVVYHLAAKINLSTEKDDETEQVNLQGTRNVIRMMKENSVKNLVYASSIYALQIPEMGVVDETLPFDPDHCLGSYDWSKAQASLEVQEAACNGIHAVLLCPTAVTGPFDFQISEAGRGILYHLPSGIKFNVNGGYNFVDVRDIADGFIQAAKNGRNGETYILGGEYLDVEQVAQVIWDAAGGWHLGIHLPDFIADLAAGLFPFFSDDPLVTSYSLAAIRSNSLISWEKAARELNFRPRPARQAIQDAVQWFLERGEEHRFGIENVANAPA